MRTLIWRPRRLQHLDDDSPSLRTASTADYHYNCTTPTTPTTNTLHLLPLQLLLTPPLLLPWRPDATRSTTTTFYKKAGGTPTSATTCQPRPAPHLRGRGRRLHNLTAATISYSAAARANESSVLDRISITCTLVINRLGGIASRNSARGSGQ